MQTYSQLLQLCRTQQNLTQQEFVNRLSHFSPHFKNLNTITMSRWETGKTIPGLQKRKALFRYMFTHHVLDIPACATYIHKGYESLVEPLSIVLDDKYKGMVGNFLPFKVDKKQYHFKKIKHCTDNELSYIINLETANHPEHYYTLSICQLREWCNFTSSFCLMCELDKEHLGHIIMLKVGSETAFQLIKNKKSIFSLTHNDLLAPHQKGYYLIHTFFGVNSEIVAMLSIKALLFLLKHRKEVQKIITFITRKEALKLARLYGHEIVCQGYNENQNYMWYSTFTSLDKILFSDLIIRMLFNSHNNDNLSHNHTL